MSESKKDRLIGFSESVGKTFGVMKNGAKGYLKILGSALLLLLLFVAVLVLVFFVAYLVFGKSFELMLVTMPLLVVATYLMLVIGATMYGIATLRYTMALLNDSKIHSVWEMFWEGKKYILSFWGLSMFSGLVAMGGFIPLIIPGILFSFWFGFAPLVRLFENVGGFSAMTRSREYTKGRLMWYLRMNVVPYVVYFVLVFVMAVVTEIFKGNAVEYIFDALHFVVVLLFSWFSIVFGLVLYKSMMDTRDLPSTLVSDRAKFGLVFAAIFPLILFALFVFIGSWATSQYREVETKLDVVNNEQPVFDKQMEEGYNL